MAKILLVVESPAKAKTISKYLGDDFIVRATMGHIFDLATEGKGNIGVNIEKGFVPKYVVNPDKADKIKAILSAAKEVSEIYVAADPDREGEAIAWHVAEVLKHLDKPIKRVMFHEITKAAIKKAVQNPGELNKELYDAQQARRVLDRIVGFSVSPMIMQSFGPKLSAGRVQSVAVRIVVDREREIEGFKPEEYWNVTATLAKPNTLSDSFVAKYTNKITDEKTAASIKKDLDKDSYVVKSIEEIEKQRSPLPPLITSSLASYAAGRYGFAAARTMKAAQKLYEAGFITYTRTDSVRSSPEAVQSCRKWLVDNGHDIPGHANAYNTKKDAQDAHEAIRPTEVGLAPDSIFDEPDSQKVYGLIWERFVASQMKPAIYDSVTADIETSSGHMLRASGRTLKYKGWLEISKDFEKDKNTDVKLPVLKQKDKLVLVDPKVKAEQKFTQPPSRYSEQTLIKELEKRGIGRPSTYATIMSKITGRNYIEIKSKMFVPTDLGKKIVDALVANFKFMDISYTSEMELNLDKIADGKLKYVEMLLGFYEPFKAELKKAIHCSDEDYGFKCPKCAGKMILKHGKFGFYLACIGYPKDCSGTMSCDMVNDKPVPKATSKQYQVVDNVFCPKCKAPMVKRTGKFGEFYSCSTYPKCKGSSRIPFGKKCPECSAELYATIWKGKEVLFCMGYPNCKHSENLPPGTIPNPEKYCKSPKIHPKVKKILKGRVKKA